LTPGSLESVRTHLSYELLDPLVDLLRRIFKLRRHFPRFLKQRHLVRSGNRVGLVEDMGTRADSGRVYADAVAHGFSNYRANMYRRRQKDLNKKNEK